MISNKIVNIIIEKILKEEHLIRCICFYGNTCSVCIRVQHATAKLQSRHLSVLNRANPQLLGKTT